VSNHRFLALRVRAAGHPRTRGSYFINVQTEGPTNDDLWQHRLYFSRDDGGWEDVFVRLAFFTVSFVRLVLTGKVGGWESRFHLMAL